MIHGHIGAKNESREAAKTWTTFVPFTDDQTAGVRRCLLCLDGLQAGLILCTCFPGDREIDKHHPPTTFTKSGEKLIDLQCWEVMLDSKTILKHLPFQEICYFISKTDKIRFIPIQYCCTRFINMTPPTSSKGKIGFYIIFLIALKPDRHP